MELNFQFQKTKKILVENIPSHNFQHDPTLKKIWGLEHNLGVEVEPIPGINNAVVIVKTQNDMDLVCERLKHMIISHNNGPFMVHLKLGYEGDCGPQIIKNRILGRVRSIESVDVRKSREFPGFFEVIFQQKSDALLAIKHLNGSIITPSTSVVNILEFVV